MTTIKDILAELASVSGICGTALVTSDGMMVESVLRRRFADDVVAGLASFLVSTTRRAVGKAGRLDRFTVHSTNGKLVLTDVGEAFLVAIADQFADLDPMMVEIDEAARRLRRIATINT